MDCVRVVCIHDGKVWLENGTLPLVPATELQGSFRWLGEADGERVVWQIEADENMHFESANALLPHERFFCFASQALQLVWFFGAHRYCGSCGQPTQQDDKSVVCGNCHIQTFPRISPCVIVAVKDGSRLLLARHASGKRSRLWTVLAGYIDTGETAEDAVRREVKEETNLDVKEISYFGSQPWPFPSQLMLAFTATVKDATALRPDAEEVAEARFFEPADFPGELAPKGTVARKLIDACVR